MSLTLGELDREALQFKIQASENWSPVYDEAPDSKARLIRLSTKLETKLRKYFRDMSEEAHKFVYWNGYYQKLNADLSVEVLVNDVAIEAWDETFIKVVFEEIALATALGAMAGEEIYKIPTGLTPTSSLIQQEARKHIAELVGKKLEDGIMVNNPKAKYRITNKTRTDIINSIKTSVSLGEQQAEVIERLKKTIKDPKRAEMIAQTETVNAYQGGEYAFAKQSDAKGKIWETNGAVDVCATYANLGPVPIDYSYDGRQRPTAHPRCRCGCRYIYAEEWERLNK